MHDENWVPAWDGSRYAANNAHHRVYDARFLASLPLTPTSRVLDIGCGSGEFTRTVADLAPRGVVVGVDAQNSMLAQARQRARDNQSFVRARAQELGEELADHEPFDVVFSRAVFHWIPLADHAAVLAAVRQRLAPGGVFSLEMGGAGNIARMVRMLDAVSSQLGGPTSPWTFPDAGTYLELLEEAGFEVRGGHVGTVGQRRAFDEAGIQGWLESQALMAYEYGLPVQHHATFRRAVRARMNEVRRPDGSWDLTYVRLEARVCRS
ncbi:MAG TPA: methyltransferase domain-containing protein [Polyangiaceae bacterium]|nr:methyltransferase domain-containing protein [Polyangiaceae bacterium]